MPMYYNKRDSEIIMIEPSHGVPLCNSCGGKVGSMPIGRCLWLGMSVIVHLHARLLLIMRLRDGNHACDMVLHMKAGTNPSRGPSPPWVQFFFFLQLLYILFLQLDPLPKSQVSFLLNKLNQPHPNSNYPTQKHNNNNNNKIHNSDFILAKEKKKKTILPTKNQISMYYWRRKS